MNDKSTQTKPIVTEFTELTYYNAARRALEAATNVDEVKAIRDKARQIQAYAMIAKYHQLVAYADEIVKRAERALGKKMEEEKGQRASPGRPRKGILRNPLPTLAASRVDKNLAHRARKAAAPNDTEFEASLAERRSQILAKVAKPVSAPRQQKEPARPKLDTGSDRAHASADLATLFRVTGLDEQRIALEEAGLTDRRILTIAPGGDDFTGFIDYELVEVLKGQRGIDELLIAAADYDSETFKWLTEGFIQLLFERVDDPQTFKWLAGGFIQLLFKRLGRMEALALIKANVPT
jgi:hypothetical protein